MTKLEAGLKSGSQTRLILENPFPARGRRPIILLHRGKPLETEYTESREPVNGYCKDLHPKGGALKSAAHRGALGAMPSPDISQWDQGHELLWMSTNLKPSGYHSSWSQEPPLLMSFRLR